MQIEKAQNYRESVIALLQAEKLPVDDLPQILENFVVAKQGKEITGVAGIEIYGNNGLLRSVAVAPGCRNRGIAGTLLECVEVIAVAKSLRAIYLLTETAQEYFAKKGYQEVQRADVPAEVRQSAEFTHMCPQSAIVMKKVI